VTFYCGRHREHLLEQVALIDGSVAVARHTAARVFMFAFKAITPPHVRASLHLKITVNPTGNSDRKSGFGKLRFAVVIAVAVRLFHPAPELIWR
jgi:hypothetical protein